MSKTFSSKIKVGNGKRTAPNEAMPRIGQSRVAARNMPATMGQPASQSAPRLLVFHEAWRLG